MLRTPARLNGTLDFSVNAYALSVSRIIAARLDPLGQATFRRLPCKEVTFEADGLRIAEAYVPYIEIDEAKLNFHWYVYRWFAEFQIVHDRVQYNILAKLKPEDWTPSCLPLEVTKNRHPLMNAFVGLACLQTLRFSAALVYSVYALAAGKI